MPRPRVVVLGVGNVLHGDDGVGVRAVRALERGGLPGSAAAYDMGTALLDLPAEAGGCERVVIVDAVESGGEPGSVYRVELDEIDEARAAPVSLHQVGVREMLALCRLSGLDLGPAVLLGVEAADTSLCEELSGPVRRAMPRLLEAVRNEMEAALAPSEEVGA